MTRVRGATWAMALGAVLMLASCGGAKTNDSTALPSTSTLETTTQTPSSTPAIAASKAPHACTLLTTSEVAAAFGKKSKDGKEDGGSDISYCKFAGDGNDFNFSIFVKADSYAIKNFDTVHRDNSHEEAVSGVGDKAYLSSEVGLTFVAKGLIVQLLGLGAGEQSALKGKYVNLAGTVIGRL